MAFIRSLGFIVIGLASLYTYSVDTFEFSTAEKAQQASDLVKTLRCPQCQNQNLIDSNSPIAKDLRQIIYEKVEVGQSSAEITQFMTERYGDFVLYEPKKTGKTLWLWLAPFVILGFAGFWMFRFIKRQKIKVQAATLTEAEQHKIQQLLKGE
jgi:cytochrome c-type biogenesis protein CcmH/NrfF